MNKRILVAPLNWGLGHAGRCIPIINALLNHNYIPIIASDGAALSFLKKEFPQLEALELPAYNIRYSKKGTFLKLKLLMDAPKIMRTVRLEQDAIKRIVKAHALDGIISDNRFGIYHDSIPSVFITHQLQVLSGNTTWLSTLMHQKIIRKFHACWVPDHRDEPYLSGKLGHIANLNFKITYIGSLSRFKKQNLPALFDVMILLSGPEPQRGLLEKKLLHQFEHYEGTVLFVRGVIEEKQTCHKIKNMTVYNYMTSELLEHSLNSSKIIVARSGYTTIMDLATLDKKAFFIPTPGQFEQIYLAAILMKNRTAPSCEQDEFTLDKLKIVDDFNGFKTPARSTDFSELFRLFESK